MRYLYQVFMFCLFLLIIPINSTAYSYSDEVVAEVDGKPITLSFVRAIKDVFALPSEKAALDFIIDSYVVLEYAKRSKIHIDDDEIDFMMKKMFGKMGKGGGLPPELMGEAPRKGFRQKKGPGIPGMRSGKRGKPRFR